MRVAFFGLTVAGAMATAIVLTGSPAPSIADAITPARVHVLDGDTIRLDGRRPDVRLVGFNAPETTRAECTVERDLGESATQRLRQLVTAGGLELQFVPCACPTRTEGTPACNFGRRCAVLRARGKDVGAVLIAERLAVPFQCDATRCPATPRPWC